MNTAATQEPTMTAKQIADLKSRAAAIVASRTTEQLISDFDATENSAAEITDDPLALAEVRGWIMDALEARNPDAFTAWIDGDFDNSPRKYFV